jgi:hypothetical protein
MCCQATWTAAEIPGFKDALEKYNAMVRGDFGHVIQTHATSNLPNRTICAFDDGVNGNGAKAKGIAHHVTAIQRYAPQMLPGVSLCPFRHRCAIYMNYMN